MPFTFEKQKIPDIILITPVIYKDERGWYQETYKESQFIAAGIPEKFCQDNHSMSQKNVLRGLHYQLNPHAQGKLVRVIQGSIIDIAVDLRKKSTTFGQWVKFSLDAKKMQILWIPPGFAHGFVALEDNTHILYKTTNEYSPSSEGGIIWNDPSLAIDWEVKDPLVSPKDAKYPTFKECVNNFE